MGVFIPTYFSPIAQYGAMFLMDEITFEVEDNYQKQTFRNRCYIYGPNGKQLLNIPVSHLSYANLKKTKDTLVEKGSNWQSQHLKSLKTAYNASPFFEFYIDDLMPIFSKSYTYILDVSLDTFYILNQILELNISAKKSSEYKKETTLDFRYLAKPKSANHLPFKEYYQVFNKKSGFLKNLSILDLLFMEGPNSISFLDTLCTYLD